MDVAAGEAGAALLSDEADGVAGADDGRGMVCAALAKERLPLLKLARGARRRAARTVPRTEVVRLGRAGKRWLAALRVS